MNEEVKDGFVVCPHCGSNMCYKQSVGTESTFLCMTCGFTTTTLMKEGSETEQRVTEKQPQLYKDLKFIDSDGLVWYPSVTAVPEIGIVYVDGTSVEDWNWVGTPFRKLSRHERRHVKQYKGKEYVADSAKTKKYGQDGFMEAAVEIGLFDKQ